MQFWLDPTCTKWKAGELYEYRYKETETVKTARAVMKKQFSQLYWHRPETSKIAQAGKPNDHMILKYIVDLPYILIYLDGKFLKHFSSLNKILNIFFNGKIPLFERNYLDNTKSFYTKRVKKDLSRRTQYMCTL